MIIDVTGTELIPGNCGRDCPGNVENNSQVCCCDECDYMMCCLPTHREMDCVQCGDKECPRALDENSL